METRERMQLRKVLKIVGAITFILVVFTSFWGYSTAKYMREMIREDFNRQQMALARVTAQKIEADLQDAVTDLMLLNSLPAIQYCDAEAYEILLLSTLPVLSRDHILEIRRVGRDGGTLFTADEQGIGMRHFGPVQQEAGIYLSWASDIANRGKVMGTSVRPRDPVRDKHSLVMDLVIPTIEDSQDVRHPKPSHGFSGYVKATVDVERLLRDTLSGIRSGKSGYGWVIDSAGNFLYHPEPDFVGENAFEVRAGRNPNISFAAINELQSEEMLKGKEGTGVYVSGWHRDVVEPMEKLIAYTPVRIQGPYMNYVWSVGVVAPLNEIESAVSTVYARQMLFEGAVILIILIGSLTVVLYELRWSTILEHEVDAQTKDITRYTSELKASEEKYRSLVESAEDLIFTLDADGVFRTANRYMADLWGMTGEALPGRSLYQFMPEEQAAEQVRLIRAVLRDGKGRKAETVLTAGGEHLWFNVHYLPLQGEGEENGTVLGIARDVTDRKSLEKQLINTEKLASLGTLSAGVAHEINNPLGIMLGFCDLLLERMDSGTMEYNDLKTIERHGLHCKSIVERLLSFARISEDTEDQCDLNDAVDSILSVVRHTLSMNDIRLSCRFAEGLPMVSADSRGLQQVFLNLINNAVYAMNGKGTLTVVTRPGRKPGRVEAVVSDTGCGIKKEFLQKVFDPFFTTKNVGEGTGLGLSVSYGIVTKYGGTIECESVSREDSPENSGTVFTLSLPVVVDESGESVPELIP